MRSEEVSSERCVIVSSVTKQHAYQTAVGAHKAGLLAQFFTPIYWRHHRLPYSVIDRIDRRYPLSSDLVRLQARRHEALDDDLVASIPVPELSEQLLLRIPGLTRLVSANSITYLKNEAFDALVARRKWKPAKIFHSFEQASLFSFRRAKRMGLLTILDQPMMHIDAFRQVEREERSRVGFSPIRRRPFWYQEHVNRKYQELELADYIFVGLDFVRQSLIANGIPDRKIFVIPYGADRQRLFKPIHRPQRKTFTILHAGPLNWHKGLPCLLDAFQELGIPEARLIVAGRSVPEIEWMTYFRKRFEQLAPHCSYVGAIPQAHMPRYYGEADVFVFPSVIGGLGMVVYEAMSTGLPVIVSDGDVIIRDGIDGLVSPPRDVESLKKNLWRLYRDVDLRAKLAQNALTRVKDFDWNTYHHKIGDAYLEILSKHISIGPQSK